MAHMKRTKYGKVDLDYVLGIGGFDLERYDFFAEVDRSSMHLLRFNCCGSPEGWFCYFGLLLVANCFVFSELRTL